ncbi:gametocyte-specific factor 1 homolog [Drosophila rhopaloa]|uniref:Gametocyte-specific factor 1 homolog n=1 Tax=Drosophila rhopaloa TaxID=1041015 RepID=A0A6P4FEF2_DRORH|nr:gametocyte-specific factor 1 homolog [Drosophila rhopaloa]
MSAKNYEVGGPNFKDYIVCPYDSVHRLMPSRLAWHLTRCAKNFPAAKMVHCPFNSTHLHSVADMKDHVTVCPNRSTLERYILPDALPPAEPRANEFLVEAEEDWDAEPPAPTYNPQDYCENAAVIRNPQGKSAAARRQFREDERKRFMENYLNQK